MVVVVDRGEVTVAATGADQEAVEVVVLVEGEVDPKEAAGAEVVEGEAGRRPKLCRVIEESKYHLTSAIRDTTGQSHIWTKWHWVASSSRTGPVPTVCRHCFTRHSQLLLSISGIKPFTRLVGPDDLPILILSPLISLHG